MFPFTVKSMDKGKTWGDTREVLVGVMNVSIHLNADDTVLLADKLNNLQKALKRLNEYES